MEHSKKPPLSREAKLAEALRANLRRRKRREVRPPETLKDDAEAEDGSLPGAERAR